MGSHLTSQFSTMNTTRDKASSMKQISPSDSQVPNFDEYDTVKKKWVTIQSPRGSKTKSPRNKYRNEK